MPKWELFDPHNIVRFISDASCRVAQYALLNARLEKMRPICRQALWFASLGPKKIRIAGGDAYSWVSDIGDTMNWIGSDTIWSQADWTTSPVNPQANLGKLSLVSFIWNTSYLSCFFLLCYNKLCFSRSYLDYGLLFFRTISLIC